MTNDRDEKVRIELEDGEGGILVVRLTGYLDTYNSVDFQKSMMEIVESGRVRLILDCRELSYVSSTGIGALTMIVKAVKPEGGDTVFLNVQPKVMEVFRLLGFAAAFTMKDSLADAVAHLRGGGRGGSEMESPITFSCPVCFKKLKAVKSGRFRCSLCRSVLQVGSAGEVSLV
jgi:anti-sigma B factor antagonist